MKDAAVVELMANPICQACGNVVRILHTILQAEETEESQDFSHGTVQSFEESASRGCRFCRLLANGFQSSGCDFPSFRFWFERGMDSDDASLSLGFLEVWTATIDGQESCHFEAHRKPGDIQIPIQIDPSSKWVLEIGQNWLRTCDEEHNCGTLPNPDAWLPTRLLDLGETSDSNIKLVTAKNVLGSNVKETRTRYAALSHCWGIDPSAIPRTLLSNLKERQKLIALESLSKTFQDFIMVTRSLGIRYAWIDSLCIIQDSEEDWQLQCVQMNKVYAHAYCTICASDSSNGNGGCFISREKSEIYEVEFSWGVQKERGFIKEKFAALNPFKSHKSKAKPSTKPIVPQDYLKIYPYFAPFEKAITGPLAARAWTLQERELSPRIIHFTRNRVLWECRRCVASEEFQTMKEKSKKKQSKGVFEHSATRTFDEKGSAQNPYLAWQAVVEDYSRRLITKKKDRLPALSALAARFSQLNECSNYVAGVWAENLLPSLAWFPTLERETPPSQWPQPSAYPGLPSWSWSSFDGPIKHYGNDWFGARWSGVVPTIDAAPISTKTGLDPFGGCSGGEAQLSGLALEVTVSEADHSPEAFSQYAKKHEMTVTLGRPGNVVAYSGKPRLRHHNVFEAGISMVSVGQIDSEGNFQASGFYEKGGEPDYRPKSLVDLTSRPPKAYILVQGLDMPVRSMCIMFDMNPVDLPETDLLCFQLGRGKSPWPLSGIPTENGLVLMRTANPDRNEYHRVGLFAAERDDPNWCNNRKKTTVFIV